MTQIDTNLPPKTLYHHGPGDYYETAAKAAANAEEKLGAIIAKGKADLPTFLAMLDREQENREDSVLPAAGLRFHLDDMAGETLHLGFGEDVQEKDYSVHSHAFTQLLGRGVVNYNAKQGRELLASEDPWQRQMLVRDMNEIYSHTPGKVLVRAVDGRTKGVMSDKYGVKDTRPLLGAFAEAVMRLGALPVMTHNMDVRTALKVVFPTIYSPFEYERIAFGAMFHNSDYGSGALDIRVFMIRLWCSNFATMESELRSVHLGGRLAEGIDLAYDTHQKTQEALQLTIRDVVDTKINPAKFTLLIERIQKAASEELEGRDAVVKLLGKHFGKKQSEEIIEVYSGANAPIEALPPGNNKYRLSQAIGWWAQSQEDQFTRVDAEQKAGVLLGA
jgi:hypothetical protein